MASGAEDGAGSPGEGEEVLGGPAGSGLLRV